LDEKIVLPYKIKKKHPYIKAYTIVSFVMLIFALICLFAPFLPIINTLPKTMLSVYMIIGGVCTPFFAFVLCYCILNMTSPTTGFTITEKGFTDYTMADGGVGFIPAEAIISLKLFGDKNKQSKQFLGIRLDNSNIAAFGKTKKARQEIQNNIESGMPAIILRQCDLKISIRELLKILLEVFGQPDTKGTPSKNEQDADVISVPSTLEEDDNASENATLDLQNNDEVLEILQDDNNEPQMYNSTSPIDDVPLTIDYEPEKPHITNIDDLLSHIFEKKSPKSKSNEE